MNNLTSLQHIKRSGREDTPAWLAGRKVCCKKRGSVQGESKQKCIPLTTSSEVVQTAALAQPVQDVHPPYILLSGILFRADVHSFATLNRLTRDARLFIRLMSSTLCCPAIGLSRRKRRSACKVASAHLHQLAESLSH